MSGRAAGALLGLALACGCSHDLDALRSPGGGMDAGRDGGGMDAGRDGGGMDAGRDGGGADAGCACDDGIDCTTDTCMPDGSCSHAPVDSACDDGLSCTMDTCSPTDGCANVPPTDDPTVCDDGNPCTDDACDPSSTEDETGCTHTPNSGPCDDGVFCNGPDTCEDSSCIAGTSSPCPGASTCDEVTDMCEGCVDGGDCPAPMPGSWSACGEFADTCDQDGTRTRTVTSYSCSAGSCEASTFSESDTCSRTTDGNSCAGDGEICTNDVCADGVCTHSPVAEGTACADDGNDCTADVCQGGSCTHDALPDGTQCGTDAFYDVCCAGSCRGTKTSTEHCGGCYVACDQGADACNQGHCRTCTFSSICPEGFACNGLGDCWCGDDSDCPQSWQMCESGRCRGVMPAMTSSP